MMHSCSVVENQLYYIYCGKLPLWQLVMFLIVISLPVNQRFQHPVDMEVLVESMVTTFAFFHLQLGIK